MQDITVKRNGESWQLLAKVEKLEGEWITGEELGRHLGYELPGDSVRKIFNRHKDCFVKDKDYSRVKLTRKASCGLSDEIQRETIIYSERGSLKIIRYSDTAKADEVIDHVFDVFLEAKKSSQSDHAKLDFCRQKFLEDFMREKPTSWKKVFPDSFCDAVLRMYGRRYSPGMRDGALRTFIVGKIYRVADDEILDELRGRNAEYKHKHHQFLSDKAIDWLVKQLATCESIIRASRYNKRIFNDLYNAAFPRGNNKLLENFSEEVQAQLMLTQFEFPF